MPWPTRRSQTALTMEARHERLASHPAVLVVAGILILAYVTVSEVRIQMIHLTVLRIGHAGCADRSGVESRDPSPPMAI